MSTTVLPHHERWLIACVSIPTRRDPSRSIYSSRSLELDSVGEEHWMYTGPSDCESFVYSITSWRLDSCAAFAVQPHEHHHLDHFVEDFNDPNAYAQCYAEDFDHPMFSSNYYSSIASSQGSDGSSSSSYISPMNYTSTFSMQVAPVPRFETSDMRRGEDKETDFFSYSGDSNWNVSSSSTDSCQGFVQPHATSISSSHIFASPSTNDMDSMPNTPENLPGALPIDGTNSMTANRPVATNAIRVASGRRRKYPVACHCLVEGCGQDFTTAFSRDRTCWIIFSA